MPRVKTRPMTGEGSDRLTEVPREEWDRFDNHGENPRIRVLRSKRFLVQEFFVRVGVVRLTINSVERNSAGWSDRIGWEDLRQIKRQCGYGDKDGIECFPPERDVVNVANMRHLFIFLDSKIDVMWRS